MSTSNRINWVRDNNIIPLTIPEQPHTNLSPGFVHIRTCDMRAMTVTNISTGFRISRINPFRIDIIETEKQLTNTGRLIAAMVFNGIEIIRPNLQEFLEDWAINMASKESVH
ncbi:hypothetical protein DPMN_054636 [Dreissena polymorpha]|uniref:Uncharacterized protein n=1 Tax=Dreissena polymorpha TaxID=45954 RepID=A0A9D4CR26_DREPO|nr:hypothetical protein DPMN_054636 [Dreissena polymorpha]